MTKNKTKTRQKTDKNKTKTRQKYDKNTTKTQQRCVRGSGGGVMRGRGGTDSVSVSVRVSSESASLSLESGRPETNTQVWIAISLRMNDGSEGFLTQNQLPHRRDAFMIRSLLLLHLSSPRLKAEATDQTGFKVLIRNQL